MGLAPADADLTVPRGASGAALGGSDSGGATLPPAQTEPLPAAPVSAPAATAPQPMPTQGAPGLISGALGNVAFNDPGSSVFPSTLGDRADWFADTRRLMRAAGASVATYGSLEQPDFAGTIPEGFGPQPEPRISAEDANRQFGIPGKLTFSAPVPASVAQSMNDAKHEELMRQDAAARYPAGFFNGAASLGAGFVEGMLDPLNVGAALIPVIGEARVAGVLARAGVVDMSRVAAGDLAAYGAAAIPGLAERLAVRGAAGAAAGTIGQLPLVGMRLAISRQEQSDYTAADALADIAMGAGTGAVLHNIVGGVRDILGERVARSPVGQAISDSPDTNQSALRVAAAQLVDDRPVEVRPVVESAAPAVAEEGGETVDAAFTRAREAASGAPDGDTVRAQQLAEDAAATAPKDMADAAAQAQQHTAELNTWAQTARDAGTVSEAELAQASAPVEQAQGFIGMVKQAAACLAGGLF